MLIARCRAKSHYEDNVEGWVTLTVRKAAAFLLDEAGRGQDYDAWHSERVEMWQALVDGGIIELNGDPGRGAFDVRLIQFAKYQTPKGSSTERTREQRARAGTSTPHGTNVGREGDAGGHDGTHRDRDRDREKGIVKEGGSAYAPTPPELNPDLTACFRVVRMFAAPGELEQWTELLNQHRLSNAQAPVECWANAMLKVSAYAAEHHGSRLAIGKAWNRFHRDFSWARQDAHSAQATAPAAYDPSGKAPEGARNPKIRRLTA
jgi:hypothetical protein